MKDLYTGNICCDFCGVTLGRQEIADGGYDREDRHFETHCCCSCYSLVKNIINEGQIDFLCEDRMNRINREEV